MRVLGLGGIGGFLPMLGLYAQPLQFPATTAENRKHQEAQLFAQNIEAVVNKAPSAETENDWEAAFWAMELMQVKTPIALKALQTGFAYAEASDGFHRALMEASYALFPQALKAEVAALSAKTKNPKVFAMTVHYLLRADDAGEPSRRAFLATLKAKFSDWESQPILYLLAADLQITRAERLEKRPPVEVLLAAPIEAGKPVLFSFHRLNRDYPGLTVIRRPDGRFVRNEAGGVFAIPHLARAVGNYAGYLTNGNTPQGIFSWQGYGVSENVFIGPTPNLQLILPFEGTDAQYFHLVSGEERKTNEAHYGGLLPAIWRDYLPIWEAYYAGKAGRNEIIAHGTTINPDFYKGAAYFPNTPSLGCMTASELWSPQDGTRIKSDQVLLIEQLKKVGPQDGYWVVVELDAAARPVSLEELEVALLTAEFKLTGQVVPHVPKF